MSEIDRLGLRGADFRKILDKRRQRFKDGQQRRPCNGLDDQSIAFLAQDGLFAWKLQVAGNPQGLISAIAEKSDVTVGVHGWPSSWHRPSIGQAGRGGEAGGCKCDAQRIPAAFMATLARCASSVAS